MTRRPRHPRHTIDAPSARFGALVALLSVLVGAVVASAML